MTHYRDADDVKAIKTSHNLIYRILNSKSNFISVSAHFDFARLNFVKIGAANIIGESQAHEFKLRVVIHFLHIQE